MKFIVISATEVNFLAQSARCNEKARAVLRALTTCRAVECVSCGDGFTRRNEVATWIVAFASDERNAEFGVRPICKRCVPAASGLDAAMSSVIAPTVGTA